MSDTDVLEVQHEQRTAARRATMDNLRSKRRAEKVLEVVLNEGEDPVSFLFRALSATEYDKLVTANPPNKEQLAQGMAWNPNTFGPALLAKVTADPDLSLDEWNELWKSPDWSGGEISQLFNEAIMLCNRGLDLAPTAAG